MPPCQIFLLKMAQPWSLFRLFLSFRSKNYVASRIRTRVVVVEGRNAGQSTLLDRNRTINSPFQAVFNFKLCPSSVIQPLSPHFRFDLSPTEAGKA